VCVFFQCFSSFSHLCSCVGQALFGHIKIVSVTAFFLMKNVLRHDREKDVGPCKHGNVDNGVMKGLVQSNKIQTRPSNKVLNQTKTIVFRCINAEKCGKWV